MTYSFFSYYPNGGGQRVPCFIIDKQTALASKMPLVQLDVVLNVSDVDFCDEVTGNVSF